MKKIVMVGGGGHAKVLIELIRAIKNWEIVGIVEKSSEEMGKKVLGIPVIGTDDKLHSLWQNGINNAVVAVGSVKDNFLRKKIFEGLLKKEFNVPTLIHPNSYVSPSAQLGIGCHIIAGTIVQSNVIIGNNVLINSGAIVEHDCILGDHVHIATGAKLASTVKVGDLSFIGIGTNIRQQISIGKEVTVGAGSTVLNNIDDKKIIAGIPAVEI